MKVGPHLSDKHGLLLRSKKFGPENVLIFPARTAAPYLDWVPGWAWNVN